MQLLRPFSAAVRWLRAWARAGGAHESGQSALLELAAVNAAGDTLVAVALAGTLFFNVPVGQARNKVALYLLVTMAPFAVVAPVIGPVLDRLRGRRAALAATFVVRGFLCWTLAGGLADPIRLYPVALGVLVASRAFGVARSAIVPRVLPPGGTLVQSNSKMSITGVIAGVVVAPVGLGVSRLLGPDWVLRLTSLIFVAGLFRAYALPQQVDIAKGELPARGLQRAAATGRRFRAGLGGLPVALRTASVQRMLVGFLTLFLAFLLRASGAGSLALGALALSAAVGSGLGVFIGGKLGRHRPELLLTGGLAVSTAACVVGALLFGVAAGLIVATVATLSGSLSKLALDAVIQRDIAEHTRASAFGRSETALQLAWVLGGVLGLLPIPQDEAGWGLAGAAVVLALVLVTEIRSLAANRGRRAREPSPPQEPDTEPQHEADEAGSYRYEPQPSAPDPDTLVYQPTRGGPYLRPPPRDLDDTGPLPHYAAPPRVDSTTRPLPTVPPPGDPGPTDELRPWWTRPLPRTDPES